MRAIPALALIVAAAGALSLPGCGSDTTGASTATTPADTPAVTTMPGTALSDAERAALLRLREEEKLARDLYTALAPTSGDRRFTNIARSEQRHMDAVGDLLASYEIPDPAQGRPAGSFASAELQELYDRLLRDGSASPEAAIAQGVIVERTDIADIDAALPQIDEPDIERVFAWLRVGSERHLQAFTRA